MFLPNLRALTICWHIFGHTKFKTKFCWWMEINIKTELLNIIIIILIYITIIIFFINVRDEHKYSNIRIFEYFGARINIRICFHDKVHNQIYSNIHSVLWLYSNNIECFEQTGCMSYGPTILREHCPPLVYQVSLVKKQIKKI